MNFKRFFNKYISIISLFIFLFLWQFLKDNSFLPKYIIPSPLEIFKSFFRDYKLLIYHSKFTILETVIGIFIGTFIAFILAIIMDKFNLVYKILYPFLIILQTIPTIAIAPILVLLLGYDLTPKIVLIAITTSFPVIISILDGFKNCDEDYITLLKTMNADDFQIFWHFKVPNTLKFFFSGLKVSVSYAFISATVSEWLGGFNGLGVYMIRAKKLFQYDTMFAIIIIISSFSLISVFLMKKLERYIIKWENWEDL